MFAAIIMCGVAGNAVALDVLPLRTTNQNPFILIHDLPADEGGAVLAPGAGRLELSLDVSNHYAQDAAADESLVLDGETHLLTFRFRRGIGAGWQVGADVPCLSHSGGFLDSFILNWHDAFGLQQHGRDTVENNLLAFRYTRDDATPVNVGTRQSGIGDVRLLAGFQLADAPEGPKAALHASLALPTGDAEALLGSGGADLALWLSARGPLRAGGPGWTWYGSAGALFPGRGDVLPELQTSLAGFGSIGLAWQPAAWIMLQLQVNAHSALYEDVQVRPLESSSTQLVMGGALRLDPRTRLDLAVVEDAAIGTAPDISFHLNLRREF